MSNDDTSSEKSGRESETLGKTNRTNSKIVDGEFGKTLSQNSKTVTDGQTVEKGHTVEDVDQKGKTADGDSGGRIGIFGVRRSSTRSSRSDSDQSE
ncbi:hypothetical protein [Halohasta litchfieldiae]|jgi:hypothetical protein|uniref:hypothetical protein n=1 Tax=Halohasta litchfieldiae TaxID=1073996 RepID=UPI001160006A|nr:hypothetical protein [Halohasta litchfieldiae]